MKHCLDCKYVRILPRANDVLCRHAESRDMIGYSRPAWYIRQYGKCGEAATLFELKPQRVPWWERIYSAVTGGTRG